MNIIEYPDRDALMTGLAATLAEELSAALTHKARATLAVPGGTTPGPLFDVLSAADLEWERVDVMLTDERWVAEGDARSNTRLVRQRLLTNRAAKARLVPLYIPAETPEDALPDLARGIGPLLPVDILLLGMGDDMHTASLFPGAPGLRAAISPRAPILSAQHPPGTAEARISLTVPALKGAINAHLLILGAGKRAALHQARRLNDPERAPVSALLDDISVHWAA